MNIIIKREIFNTTNTISKLYINDSYFCDVLEDQDRGLHATDTLEHIKSIKVHGKTAIPYGTYEVIVSFSNRFQTLLPLLVAVPGYDGIRIHPGNDENDTEGCLLPGTSNGQKVLSSKIAFTKLFGEIKKVYKKEKIFITIKSSK